MIYFLSNICQLCIDENSINQYRQDITCYKYETALQCEKLQDVQRVREETTFCPGLSEEAIEVDELPQENNAND